MNENDIKESIKKDLDRSAPDIISDFFTSLKFSGNLTKLDNLENLRNFRMPLVAETLLDIGKLAHEKLTDDIEQFIKEKYDEFEREVMECIFSRCWKPYLEGNYGDDR